MRIATATLLFIALTAQAPAQEVKASFFSGNKALTMCQQGTAVGYVAGLNDAYVLAGQAVSKIHETVSSLPKGDVSPIVRNFVEFESNWIARYCAPSGVTPTQMTDAFCRHLESNPQRRHLSASVVFVDAMVRTWPCSN